MCLGSFLSTLMHPCRIKAFTWTWTSWKMDLKIDTAEPGGRTEHFVWKKAKTKNKCIKLTMTISDQPKDLPKPWAPEEHEVWSHSDPSVCSHRKVSEPPLQTKQTLPCDHRKSFRPASIYQYSAEQNLLQVFARIGAGASHLLSQIDCDSTPAGPETGAELLGHGSEAGRWSDSTCMEDTTFIHCPCRLRALCVFRGLLPGSGSGL